MRARKKPVVIECHPAWETKLTTSPAWLVEAIGRNLVERKDGMTYVKSKEGWVNGSTRDHYIMKGVMGELYLCEKDIFNATYEVLPSVED